MWIILNDAFVSVVQDRNDPAWLLARARAQGDLERALPGAEVFEDPTADYHYRAFISRDQLKNALLAAVDRVDYDNFKASVREPRRHNAYLKVWADLLDLRDG